MRLDSEPIQGEDHVTLRLRCVRCGDWTEMDPVDGPITCLACCQKWASWRAKGLSYAQRAALWARHTKHLNRHPTYKALTAALDAMESTPHGGLAP